MTSTHTVLQAQEALKEDHRRLHALVDDLRGAGDVAALAEVLQALHQALTAHFNAEEKPGGLYDALGVCVPEFRSRLAELVDDHFRVAGLLRELRDRSRAEPAGSVEALRGEAARLADGLADHERREHELVDAALAHSG